MSDLEARALQAVHEGKFEAGRETIELATAYVQLAEAWVPRPDDFSRA